MARCLRCTLGLPTHRWHVPCCRECAYPGNWPTCRVPIHHPSTRNTAQGDEADRHKLRTAALKLRLAQLAKERRAREAADAAAFQARQRELHR